MFIWVACRILNSRLNCLSRLMHICTTTISTLYCRCGVKLTVLYYYFVCPYLFIYSWMGHKKEEEVRKEIKLPTFYCCELVGDSFGWRVSPLPPPPPPPHLHRDRGGERKRERESYLAGRHFVFSLSWGFKMVAILSFSLSWGFKMAAIILSSRPAEDSKWRSAK